eukprot:13839352-Alexandrium_andersonii.AAC.1
MLRSFLGLRSSSSEHLTQLCMRTRSECKQVRGAVKSTSAMPARPLASLRSTSAIAARGCGSGGR